MLKQDAILDTIAKAFEEYRNLLLKIIEARASVKLKTQIGVEDVLQEAFVDACKRLEFFNDKPEMPILVKLRKIVLQTLTDKERFVHADKRDSGNELYEGMDETKTNFLNRLADSITSPSKKIMRKERAAVVNEMLDELSEQDKEILIMRHFEQLGYKDCALILNISPNAASRRYVHAAQHLKKKLDELKDFTS